MNNTCTKLNDHDYYKPAPSVLDGFIGLYDENDPVMSKYGLPSWVEQCERAASCLSDGATEEAIMAIECKLINGEYF